MSLECRECEHDVRGGHDPSCSRYRPAEPATARPSPCPTCPYRCSCPSGVWAAEEYDKLPGYDGDIGEQAVAGGTVPFFCHQGDGCVCSGWLGHRDPAELLAVRLGVLGGQLDVSVLDYRTDVELFGSGAAAAEHGKAEITEPGTAARAAVAKITRVRGVRGQPVTADDTEER